MVGEAFTLRYIPAREDLNPIARLAMPVYDQRASVSTNLMLHQALDISMPRWRVTAKAWSSCRRKRPARWRPQHSRPASAHRCQSQRVRRLARGPGSIAAAEAGRV